MNKQSSENASLLFFEAGQIILRQGEETDFAFKILCGSVDLFYQTENEIMPIKTRGVGDFIGVAAVYCGKTLTYSARTRELTTIMVFTRQSLDEIFI